MTIPPMEVPPSRATNAAVPLPPGSDVDISVEPDEPVVEGATKPSGADSAVPEERDNDS